MIYEFLKNHFDISKSLNAIRNNKKYSDVFQKMHFKEQNQISVHLNECHPLFEEISNLISAEKIIQHSFDFVFSFTQQSDEILLTKYQQQSTTDDRIYICTQSFLNQYLKKQKKNSKKNKDIFEIEKLKLQQFIDQHYFTEQEIVILDCYQQNQRDQIIYGFKRFLLTDRFINPILGNYSNFRYDKKSNSFKATISKNQAEKIKDRVKKIIIDAIKLVKIVIQSHIDFTKTKVHYSKCLKDLMIQNNLTELISEFDFAKQENLKFVNEEVIIKNEKPLESQDSPADQIYYVFGYQPNQTIEQIQQLITTYQVKEIIFDQYDSKEIRDKFEKKIQKVSKLSGFNMEVINFYQKNYVRVYGNIQRFIDSNMEIQIQQIIEEMQQKESMLDFKMKLDTSNQYLQRQLKLDKTPITKIESKYGISIDVINHEYVLHGLRDKTSQAAQDLSIMEFQLRQEIKKIDIEDKQQLKALDTQPKQFWEKSYHLKISYEQRYKQNLNQFQQLNQNSVQSQRLVNQIQNVQPQQSPLQFQWAYKVFPKDPNYHERTDTVNDWFYFDYDQNVQIEKYFQDCIKKAQMGKRMNITGDMGQSKNGFFYEVYGLSSDPNDWYEINIQTQRQRQLKRISYTEESMNVANYHRSIMSDIKSSNNQNGGKRNTSSEQIQPQERYQVLVVEGIGSDIQKFQQELDKIVVLQKMKKPQQQTVFSLVGYQNIIGAKICLALSQAIKSKHQCDLIVKTTHLKIKGSNHNQAYEYLINALNTIKMHCIPDAWEELECYFDECSTPKNYELLQTSEKFIKIKDLFHNGGCRELIYKIFRIQNRDVWGRFQQEKNKLRIKNGKDPLIYGMLISIF